MKIRLLIILFCFCGQLGFSQTKIKITHPRSSQDDYHLVNISDTTFIKITHKEDMGVWYMQSYDIKSTAPDGQYEVYVDDTLELKAFMKRNQKDSTWNSYFKNGSIQSKKTYIHSKLNGEKIDYYINGKIEFKGIFINDKAAGITTSYFETGEIQAKNYYDSGVYVKQEVFDKKGKLKYIYDPKIGTTITE